MGRLLIVVGLLIAVAGLLVSMGVPLGRLRETSRCAAATFRSISPGNVGAGEHHPHAGDDVLAAVVVSARLAASRQRSTPMPSIKADRWIKKMALETGMIDPFEDRQVRAGVISYGLSSYGYDIRVADEFKVFTNINSTVVDPKNFDARSFVDVKPTSASSRRTRLPWPRRSSTSGFRATS
jgi:hypothetical protein